MFTLLQPRHAASASSCLNTDEGLSVRIFSMWMTSVHLPAIRTVTSLRYKDTIKGRTVENVFVSIFHSAAELGTFRLGKSEVLEETVKKRKHCIRTRLCISRETGHFPPWSVLRFRDHEIFFFPALSLERSQLGSGKFWCWSVSVRRN